MSDELDPYKVLVGKRAEIVRDHMNFGTLQAMADALGTNHSAYSKWIQGKSLVPVKYAVFMEDEWRISMSWLYSSDPLRLKLELLPPRKIHKRA